MIPVDMLTAVEAEHPDIAARIAAIWGDPECEAYLARLCTRNRDARTGVSMPVSSALCGLQVLHVLLFPSLEMRHEYSHS